MSTPAHHDHSTLRRGIAILKILGRRNAFPGGIGVTDIAAAVGCDKSQVSRILPVLAAAGFVERDRVTRKYRLGWGVHSLSVRLRSPQLVRLAQPVLRALSARLKETTYLAALSGHNVLSLCNEAPSLGAAVMANELTGSFVPAYCTASGRALLMDFEEEELSELFLDYPLTRRGPNCPTTVAELYARIVAARRKGIAVAEDELEGDMISVAIPVHEPNSDIIMAVGFSAPRGRIEPRLPAACAAVTAAGRELERRFSRALDQQFESWRATGDTA